MHFKLIVVFIDDSKTEHILEAVREAGATGATVLPNARGEGMDTKKTFLGLTFEGRRHVILLMVEEHLSRSILETIERVGELRENSLGLALQIDIEDAVGIAHHVERLTHVVEERI